ncbi:MAG: DNA polymerase I [Gammaproteobacteria bacterium]|nr:MAG: DNA polymerase I [Gammaproteobacteria bacterium]
MTQSDKQMPRLILVDGSSYLYRAYHALPNLTNSKREPTGAVFGITSMLQKLLKEYEPEYIAVVFDAKGKTFRHDIYPDYKANRPPMPEDLRTQIAQVYDVVQALGLPLLSIEGVEADDVIGTLATQATSAGMETLISTGDKDMAQLVNEHVTLIDTMKDTQMDVAGVEQRFGVPPAAIIDYLALMGDASDNIPGVPKVGPKTAAKWLQQYGSLDNIIAHADEISGKVGDSLRASLEQLPLSRTLATIRCDVALNQTPEELKRLPRDDGRLRNNFIELEFSRMLAELEGDDSDHIVSSRQHAQYEIIVDKALLQTWIERLRTAELFAFDTETTSVDASRAELVGLSFTDRVGEAAYVPVAHDYPDAPEQLDRDYVLAKLQPLLEDDAQYKVGQNLKYDMSVLARYGITMRGIAHDTMLESYVADSTASRHDMDSLASKYLGYKTIKYEDVAGKGKHQLTFNEVDIEQAGPYAAEDADITLQLHQALWPKLQAIPALASLYTDIELPLLSVLSRIERRGVCIDAVMLRKQSSELAHRMLEIEQQAYDEAGQTFNLASPKQIQEILFEKLELPVRKRTPKGQPSTAEGVLQELALDYPLPRLILEYRGMSKLKSTYTDKLPEMINPDTGRVHTSYHQAVAATGRLSSSDPNLQNIPVRTKEGRRIRQAFVPEPGFIMMSADYSQIELRIMAHLSGDEGLLQAFQQGVDVHRATAAEVFGVSAEEVSNEQRRHAKAINFGLIYGMSAFGLAQQIKVDRSAAQDYINRYFERYPGVKVFMDNTRARAHDQSYVETLYGRRLYLPEINSSNHVRRQYAERTAINAPMQGTAADLIKLAMIAVDNWIESNADETRMIMQVHDELVFEVPEQALEGVREQVIRCMTEVAELSVPLLVDVGVGRNWDEAH